MPKKERKNKKPQSQTTRLIALPFILFALLLVLTVSNLFVQDQIDKNRINPTPFNFKLSQYPNFETTNMLDISANGVMILDSDSKKVLYEKNKDLRFSPASTVKIMTALTALEKFAPDDTLTIPQDSSLDSILNLRRGDRFRFVDLVYAMMLPSDNRAAETIAKNYKGGQDEFVRQMNQNARKWGLSDTYFADPSGILDDFDYTTPKDLALLSSIAMNNDLLRKIASTREIVISDIYSIKSYNLDNKNKLLDVSGIIGLKTGHTDAAGDVLVTARVENGHLIIIVVMNSKDRFTDTLGILDFIKDKITYLTIHP